MLLTTRNKLRLFALGIAIVWTLMILMLSHFASIHEAAGVILAPGALMAMLFLTSGVHTPGIGMMYGFVLLMFDVLFYAAIVYATLRFYKFIRPPKR